MKRRRSIPITATERTISPFRREGDERSGGIWFREVECRVRGKVVGTRSYDDMDRLIFESPRRSGKLHGTRLQWDEDGYLELVEPYRNGKIEGTARQYHRGRLVGTYTIRNGNGMDVWRNRRRNGTWYVSEIRHVQGGSWHGMEYWFNEDECSVWREAHWNNGGLHGIEREWHGIRKMCKGYPRFWLHGSRVNKRAYLEASKSDSSLPAFRLSDQKSSRSIRVALRQQQVNAAPTKTKDVIRSPLIPKSARKELVRRLTAYRNRKGKDKIAGSSWAKVKSRIFAK